MKPERLAAALAAQALAEGQPLGPVLRRVPGGRGVAAALDVEAGRLGAGLRRIGLPADVAELALVCPGALRPALRRLGNLPPPLVLRVPLLETLAWMVAVIDLHAVVLTLVRLKIAPAVVEMGALQPDQELPWSWLWWAGAAIASLAFAFGILGLLRYPAIAIGGQTDEQRAREASLAAALVQAGAPADARARVHGTFRALAPGQATVAELDLVIEASLARAAARQQATVSAVRVAGLGGLALMAAALTVGFYSTISWLPVLP